jgi:hypothetical protein
MGLNACVTSDHNYGRLGPEAYATVTMTPEVYIVDVERTREDILGR